MHFDEQFKESLLADAETFLVDAGQLLDDAELDIEENDSLSYSMELDQAATLREMVRLDVLRTLALKCRNGLSIVLLMEQLSTPDIVQHLSVLNDVSDRQVCVAQIFEDVSDAVISIVAKKRGVFTGMDVENEDHHGTILAIQRSIADAMAQRHGIPDPYADAAQADRAEESPKISNKELSAMLDQAENEVVDVDMILQAMSNRDEDTCEEFDSLPWDQDVSGAFDDEVCDDTDEDVLSPIESLESRYEHTIRDVLTSLSALCGGKLSLRLLMELRHHADVERHLQLVADDERDECFLCVFDEIAMQALLLNDRYADMEQADAKDEACDLVLALMQRHGLSAGD